MPAPSFQNLFKIVPQNRKNISFIAFTLLIFLSIPITVFVALNVRDERSRAETVPYDVLEESLKKIDLRYSPTQEKLILSGTSKESSLPKKVERKKAKSTSKILTISVEQLNEFDKPIYSFIQELEVEVNKKGELKNSEINFSVSLPAKPGKAVFSLGEKKLLEVGL